MQEPVNGQGDIPNHSAAIILAFLKLDASLNKEQAFSYSDYLYSFFNSPESLTERVRNKILVGNSDETKAIGLVAQKLIDRYYPNYKSNHPSAVFDAIIMGTITVITALHSKKNSLFQTAIAYHKLVKMSQIGDQFKAAKFLCGNSERSNDAIEDLIFTAAAGVLLYKTIPLNQENSIIMKEVIKALGTGYFNKYKPLPFEEDISRELTSDNQLLELETSPKTYTFQALKTLAKDGKPLENCALAAGLAP